MCLTILNINASQIGKKEKLNEVLAMINLYNPTIECIQEINVQTSLRYFQDYFQVVVNKEDNQLDNIGIVTLVNKKCNIEQNIIARNGRIIGTKLQECQIWNVYPISGSNHKQVREKFFREELIHYMMNWKDQTKYIIQAGDHNCTHRDIDSLNNPGQHKQPALIAEMKILGLKDAFIQVHGEKKFNTPGEQKTQVQELT